MKLFIDNECKCHVSNPDGSYTEVEAPEQLEGKCAAYIEGFRVRPEGYRFIRDDGQVFGPDGASVSAWRDLALLEEFQRQYEAQQAEAELLKAELEDADAALARLGVKDDEPVV